MSNKKKILIIDDEIISNMALESELEESGFITTFSATTYEEGVEIFERENPEFLLVDINMGSKKNGFDFIDFVNRRAKIIIISGYDKKLYSSQLEKITYLAYLEKPLDVDKLLKLLS